MVAPDRLSLAAATSLVSILNSQLEHLSVGLVTRAYYSDIVGLYK